ncbi:maltase 1-like [Cydia pomonella]|uniref:maltase 1-like n=1 Tax=Cydia pomonella TaxID=82600 RepID=UPI002ADD4D2C|nr:maltase 1-like [Cydia pomonella]
MTMWLVTLVFVIGTAAGQTVPWWNSAVYYRMLVDSFKDGDGDGLGDLQGATKQMSYVRALGADAIILSPLSTKSPDCTKPGTIDLSGIDQRYGGLDAFSQFLEKAKTLELKVVSTLNLQTTSAASEWFTSSANRVNGFEDWFLWADGSPEQPPESEPGIDQWMYHEDRKAFFATRNNASILNLCSEGIASALASAQCAWLRRGVAGLVLNPDFREQACGLKVLRKMVAEAMTCARGSNLETPAILVETSLPPEQAGQYYSDGSIGANSVISTTLTSAARSAPQLAVAFYADMLNAAQDGVPTWQTSSPNANRITTRQGGDMVDAINLLNLILPGSSIIQQGDELGSADTILEWATSDTCFPSHPLPSSAPFPWDDTANAGFTAGTPWLPLAPNYRYANAKTQFVNDGSHVGVVRVAAAMRKSPAIGPHAEIKRLGDALSILRWGGTGSLLVVSNVGKSQTEAQLSSVPGLPAEMTVAASSAGSGFTTGSHVKLEKPVRLGPGETVLLAGAPRHCGGPGPVDKIANKLNEGWQKINKYFSNL